ncbi:unnamed protein product [Debaryomyces tyrocola]|nr:unnamed protein product [Debaryomyces tyrocola]
MTRTYPIIEDNMSAIWHYVPVCIRFISEGDMHALTGVNLVLRNEDGQILYESTISISHIPPHSLKDYQLYVTSSSLCEGDDVNWHACIPSFDIPLMESRDDYLYKYLNFFKENGFKIIPNDTVPRNTLMDLNILGIEVKAGSLGKLIRPEAYKVIEFANTEVSDPITIRSCPFSFTNPLLFSNFQSVGGVNLKITKDNEILGYLSDIKYMENMAGGVVTKSDMTGSIGLVLGNLRKYNGDGDLIFILSWEIIWKLIMKRFPNLSMRPSMKSSSGIDRIRSVLPVVVSENNSLFWGSCVYYNQTTLVTNNHVIKQYIDNIDRPMLVDCKIFLTRDQTIKLTNEDVVITPYEQLDLSFIKLSFANQKRLKDIDNIAPVEYDYFYLAGELVSTIGFGLYFNNLYVEPLESTGNISVKYSLPLYKGDNTTLPCIIVTSASCWNGSSGGGLFKQSTNELVGLVCSNAQVILPALGEEEGEKTTEKLSKTVLCIPIEVINSCYEKLHSTDKLELNDRIGHTWNLIPYHNDIIVSKPKL